MSRIRKIKFSTILRYFMTFVSAFVMFSTHAQAEETGSAVMNDTLKAAHDALFERMDVRYGLRILVDVAPDYVSEWKSTVKKLEPACWDAARQLLDSSPLIADEHADACLDAAAKAIDPRASFHRPEKFNTANGAAGIGVQMKKKIGENIIVSDVFPNSPAAQAGVKPGDTISAVDGESVIGKNLNETTSLIRGEEGSPVTLSIVSPNTGKRDVKIIRGKFETHSVYSASLKNAWYVQVNNFASDTSGNVSVEEILSQASVAAEHNQIGKIIVIDLRKNTGGRTDDIVNFGGLFIPEPLPRMYTFNARGVETTRPDWTFEKPEYFNGKQIVVLVDHETGSGTEWLAESLRRNAGALIVGQQTSGRITARRMYFFRGNAGPNFRFPESELFAGSGALISGRGVIPDVMLDDIRVKEKFLGKAPSWLQTWLDTEMQPAFQKKAMQARQFVASRWDGPIDDAKSVVCAGTAILPASADFTNTAVSYSKFTLRTASFELEGEATSDSTAFDVRSRKAAILENIKDYESDLIAFRKKPKSEFNKAKIEFLTNSIERSKAELNVIFIQAIGIKDAEVMRYADSHWLLWRNGDVAHKFVLHNLKSNISNAELVNAYRSLASSLNSLNSNVASSDTHGVCVGNGLLVIDEPVLEMNTKTSWAIKSEADSYFEIGSRYSLPVDRNGKRRVAYYADADRNDDDKWLLANVDSCTSQTWPTIESRIFSGLEGLTRRSETNSNAESQCRIIRAVSRLANPPEGGLTITAGINMQAKSNDRLAEMEKHWRHALDSFKVLPVKYGNEEKGKN